MSLFPSEYFFQLCSHEGFVHTCEDWIRAEGDPNEGLMADDTDSTIGVTLVSVKGWLS